MAFYVFYKMGKAPLSRALSEIKQLLCVQFNSLLSKTNIFHVGVHLSSNRSQRTSKCGKNIIGYRLVCHFFVLTTFSLTSSATWNLFVKERICLTKKNVIVGIITRSCPLLNYVLLLENFTYGIAQEIKPYQMLSPFKS